jgi:hypothetical protein
MRQHGAGERRRKGPLNRLRRLAYGLLLALGAPLATASQTSVTDGSAPQKTVVPSEAGEEYVAALVFLRGLAAENAEPAVFGTSFSRPALGERSEWSLSTLPPPVRSGLLTLSFSDNDLRNWRRGAGIDIDLPDVGQFSRGRDALKRWNLRPRAPAHDEARHWSLGGSVDWVRSGEGDERALVFVPKLVVNAAALLGGHGSFDVCIQYAHWTARETGGVTGRVPQAVVRWSF